MIKKLILFIMGLVGVSSGWAQKAKQSKTTTPKTEIKFLDDISVDTYAPGFTERTALMEPEEPLFAIQSDLKTFHLPPIENASDLQLKYALLLSTDVEQVRNTRLFSVIDEWFGTRYQFGGLTKDGVDCSGFVKNIFSTCYGVTIPRTAQEQYDGSQPVALPEMREGDLVFFKTQGGISHVGIFLQNHKFVHSATSEGVMISDLNESYWEKHFVGAGRVPLPATDSLAVQLK